MEAALDVHRKLGATTVEVSLPNAGYAGAGVLASWPQPRFRNNLSRYDGVRFGHRAEQYDDPPRHVRRAAPEGFGAEVKRRILDWHLRAVASVITTPTYLQAGVASPDRRGDFAAALRGV